MDAAQLAAFVAVVEEKSFSIAAERLYLTQPAISKRIFALESELKTRLFDRLGRHIVLTEAGRVLLPHAQKLLATFDDSRRALANLSGDISGTLCIAISHHVGLYRLPPMLRVFVEHYPQVRLDLRFMASEAAHTVVNEGDVELAIITLPPKHEKSLISQALWTDYLRVVVAPKHPLAARKKITPFILVEYPAIFPETDTFTRMMIDDAFAPLELKPHVTFSTNYLETIKIMVSVGLGWSLLPTTMIDETLASPMLTGLHFERSLGVLRHSGRTLSNAAQAFLYLLNSYRETKSSLP
ncbi:MAG: LysR family transcriptional regulator [Burkholderiales bacterium]|jgi:DNA-binding transcriptional LysR family regulator|nr:LysR family transcriptional regulator [Burkholderiales bacterium]